jgi:PTS system glucitol/sorbitol-specific IIA component
MKYKVEVVKIGDLVEELLGENMLILFNSNAPEELAEISVLHTTNDLKEDVKPGDIIKIGDIEYSVTGVGSEANSTLKELGHCTLKFNGSSTPELPGIINLDGDIPNIKEGDTISIY